MVLLQRHVSLLSSLWPHGGCAGSYRSPVWRSKSANTGGSVPVPAVAAWGTKGRHQHPRGGTNLPKGWKCHACFLLSYISIQTHLWATGPSLWSFSVSQLMVSLCFFPISNVSIKHYWQWSILTFLQLGKEVKLKAKEGEPLKVFQTSASLCVNKGLMTAETASCYYRSGDRCDPDVCLLFSHWRETGIFCSAPLVMDADLRFALQCHLKGDITGRCVVYVHNIINTNRQRQKTQINSETMTPSEVTYLFIICAYSIKGS